MKPKYKLMILTSHKPVLNDRDDSAFWDRISLINLKSLQRSKVMHLFSNYWTLGFMLALGLIIIEIAVDDNATPVINKIETKERPAP